MGWFVNPRNGTKEKWLAKHGTPATRDEVFAVDLVGPVLPVALVDNGGFSTAAILYDNQERDVLRDPDPRAWSFYLVDRALLVSEFPP